MLIASGRKRRPQDWQREDSEPLPAHDPDCPFCPGNEGRLPGIIDEVARDGAPGWQVRVVPNKFPAVTSDAAGKAGDGACSVSGEHRVIVETPRHDLDFDALDKGAAATVMDAYHGQFCTLAARPGTESVVLFRNYGPGAGASRQHPHAQIISLDVVPPRQQRAACWAREALERHGEPPTGRYLRSELEDGQRIVDVTERFVLLVPFAASTPFEQHILPLKRQASFAEAASSERAELAGLVQSAVRRLKAAIGPLDYNWVFESALPDAAEPEIHHWRLRIVPKLSVPGGFEIGADLQINPSLPEEDAARLRDAAAG